VKRTFISKFSFWGHCTTLVVKSIVIVFVVQLFFGDLVLAQRASIPSFSQICQAANKSITTSVRKPLWTYQWQDSIPGGQWSNLVNGPNIQGAIKDTLKIVNCPILFDGRKFRCRIDSNGNGVFDYNTNACRISVTSLLGPPGSISGQSNVCFGLAANQYSVPQVAQATQYSWSVSPSASIASGQGTSSISINFPASGTYSISVTASNSCDSKTIGPFVTTYLTPITAPVIGPSQTPICYNAVPSAINSTTLPTGGGGNYSYQWESSADASTWAAIAGATLNNYSPPAQTTSRYYRLKASSQAGCGPVISNQIFIQTYPQVVSGTIQGNQSICYNAVPQILSFSTPTTGGNGSFTYQWQSSANNQTWTDIPSANSVSYQPTALNDTTWFRVKSTAQCGTVNSSPVKITVFPDFIAGTIGTAQSICHNTSPNQLAFIQNPIGGLGSGTYSYQWESTSNSNLTGFSSISGASNSNYLPSPLNDTTWFRVKVQTPACGFKTTQPVKITVHPALVGGSVQSSQTICNGTSPGQLSISSPPAGGNGPFQFQWQSSTNGIIYSNISGSTGSSYAAPNLSDTTWYQVKATNACGTITYQSAKITVRPPMNAGVLQAPNPVCFNTAPSPISFSVPSSGSATPYDYQWQQSANGVTSWTDIAGATLNSYSPGPLTDTFWLRTKVKSNSCNQSDTTFPIKIIVYGPLQSGTIQPVPTICYNSIPGQLAFGQLPTGGNPSNYTYQWQISSNNSSFTNIAGATANTYQPPALLDTTYYRLSVTSGSCGNVQTPSTKVIVFPQFSAGQVQGSQKICYNSVPNLLSINQSPAGANGSYNYQWQSSPDSLTWQDISNANSQTFQAPALNDTMYYRLKVTSPECGSLFTKGLKISVYEPLLPGSISGNQSICYNTIPSTLNFNTQASGAGGQYTYQWQKTTDLVNWLSIPQSDSFQLGSGPLSDTTWFRVWVQSKAGCDTLPTDTVRITVFPQFQAGSIGNPDSVCKGDSVLISSLNLPKGGPGTFNYGWEKSINQNTWSPVSGTSGPLLPSGTLTDTTWFRVRYTAGSGCGTGLSNQVKIVVDTLPAFPVLSGPSNICNLAQNVNYSFPYQKADDFSFLWSLSAGEIAGRSDTTTTRVNWDSLPGIAKIKIQIQNRRTSCKNSKEFNIEKSPYPAPGPTEIIHKKNSNILVCADSTPTLSYEWGFTKKSTGEKTVLSNWNKRYCLLPHSFDTTIYKYWVRSFFPDAGPYCEYISYYQGASGRPASETILGYPNPAKGEYFLRLPDNIQNAKITISDLQGRVFWQSLITNNEVPIRIPLPLVKGILFLNCTYLDQEGSLIQSNLKILAGS
jgi:hypothetical protein